MAKADSPRCVAQKEYVEYRQKLGELVNDHASRVENPKKFNEKLENWRLEFGLPLPLKINKKKANKEEIVFNNCHPACAGKVHQVFLSQLLNESEARVLDKQGHLKTVSLADSGLEPSILVELDKKGVPFRSWPVPSDNGPWYVKGSHILINLDIKGYSLLVSHKMWKVTTTSSISDAQKLQEVDAVKVLGCFKEDICLSAGERHFRIPQPCAPVVKHALDSVTEPREN